MEMSPAAKLRTIICLTLSFFIAELALGFRTSSLALIADAFHYLSDLLSYIVALVALRLSRRSTAPASLAFGWRRVEVLGAFFNGVFLLALGLSILLQAIERLVHLEPVDEPVNVLIAGCVGLGLNLVSIALVHEHHGEHSPRSDMEASRASVTIGLADVEPSFASPEQHHQRDVGLHAVMIHILGDVLNNLGVIVAALILMFVKSHARFYADPAISMAIAIVIFGGALPLTLKSGHILLCSTPPCIPTCSVLDKLRSLPGIISVHDLRIWRLDQNECVASAHIVMSPLHAETRLQPSNMGLRASRQASTSSAEECHGVPTAGEQRMRRDGTGCPPADLESETLNERLKRVREAFGESGIERLTLQIEEDGNDCDVLHAAVLADGAVEVERQSARP